MSSISCCHMSSTHWVLEVLETEHEQLMQCVNNVAAKAHGLGLASSDGQLVFAVASIHCCVEHFELERVRVVYRVLRWIATFT